MIKYELILWVGFFLKVIPGKLGCFIRSKLYPVKSENKVLIWDNVQIDFPSKLKIGSRSSVNRGCIINAGGGVEIGRDVLIGPNVIIYSQNHQFEDHLRNINEQGYIYKKVSICDDVWIGAGSIILPGVSIGKGAVIGAGSVVCKNVDAYTVNVGIPVRKIYERK